MKSIKILTLLSIMCLHTTALLWAQNNPNKIVIVTDIAFVEHYMDFAHLDVYNIYEKHPHSGLDVSHQCKVDSYRNREQVDACIAGFSGNQLGFFDGLIVGIYDRDAALGGYLRTRHRVRLGMNKEQSRAMTDKAFMRKKLRQANNPYLIPGLKSTGEISLPEALDFLAASPQGVVLKPHRGTAAMGFEHIKTTDGLRDFFARKQTYFGSEKIFGYVIERFIPGRITMIDGYVCNGELQFIFPLQESVNPRHFYSNGRTVRIESKLSLSERYKPIVERILKDLEYRHGVFHLEMIGGEDPGEKYFLEIGPRPGDGNDAILEQFGVNEFQAYFKGQLEEEYSMDYVDDSENKTIQLIFPSLGGRDLGQVQSLVRVSLPKEKGFVKSVSLKNIANYRKFQVASGHVKTLLNIVLLAPRQQKLKLLQFALQVQKRLEDPNKTLLKVVPSDSI